MSCRKGDTHAAPLDRLARRSEQVGDCWVWTGWTDAKGYGRITNAGKTVAVHLVAYREMVGPVPDGLQLDHICRVPACWNVGHLEPVTCAENVRRSESWSGRNARKTHCPAGHPLIEGNLCKAPRGRKCLTCHRLRERARRARLKATRIEAAA